MFEIWSDLTKFHLFMIWTCERTILGAIWTHVTHHKYHVTHHKRGWRYPNMPPTSTRTIKSAGLKYVCTYEIHTNGFFPGQFEPMSHITNHTWEGMKNELPKYHSFLTWVFGYAAGIVYRWKWTCFEAIWAHVTHHENHVTHHKIDHVTHHKHEIIVTW